MVEPSSGALKVWLNDCGANDLAPASSDDTSNNDCTNPPASIPVPAAGSAKPSSQASGSPNGPSQGSNSANPSQGGNANNPTRGGTRTVVVETSIPGLTVSGVTTIGNPTIYPGAIPTGGSLSQLQPIASEAAQLFASAESAIASLADAPDPSSSDVSSAEQLLADTWTLIQQLLGSADQIDPRLVTGPDAQILQNLRSKLPPLLTQLGGAIESLAPSTHGNPDSQVIQEVAGLLGSGGSIGQAFGSVIQPVVSLPAPSGGGNGGNNFGGDSFTVPSITTIPINVGLDAIPTSGLSAISALSTLASQVSSAIDAAATLSGEDPDSFHGVSGGGGHGGGGGCVASGGGGGLLGALLSVVKNLIGCILGGESASYIHKSLFALSLVLSKDFY